MPTTGLPWPAPLVERWAEQGILEGLSAACLDDERSLTAPKTVALRGPAELRGEALAELRDSGFDPRPVDAAPDQQLELVQVDPAGRSLGELLAWKAGCLYAQERSSFHYYTRVIARLLASLAGAVVLDLCAAPGGKAVLLANALEAGGGRLVANEPARSRHGALVSNLRRWGAAPRTLLASRYHHQLPPAWRGAFDLVVVDAPCSGEGLLRKPDQQGLSFWTEARVAECATRQRAILERAADCLRPGGRLVYSTCTFAPEENELAITELLERRRHLRVAEPVQVIGATAGMRSWRGRELPAGRAALRFLPRRGLPGEGLFGVEAVCTRAPEPRGEELELPAKPLWVELAAPEIRRRLGEPRGWPPLERVHAETLRRLADELGPVRELEPTLTALRGWLADTSGHGKSGAERAVLWRHLTLLVERRLPRGRSFVRRHALMKRLTAPRA